MSRTLIPLFVVFMNSSVWGQIYTPKGSYVEVIDRGEQLSASEKVALKQEWTEKYPRAFYWGEATTTYNCHAYAWSVSEGGDKFWMNTPNDDIYMMDGSYISTSSSDTKARKVSYFSDDHSAIVSYGAYLISKWGAACLMKHTPRDCPYNSNTLRYYKLSMEIIGDEIIELATSTDTISKLYTLTNLPFGATVDWIVTGNGDVIDGQGTHQINVRLNGTGCTTIAAKVNCPTGLIVYIPFNLNVIASSASIITDIEMFKYWQNTGEFTLKAISNHADGTFTWTVSGESEGKVELYEIPYPNDAMFLDEPSTFKAVRFYESGIYTITVTSTRVGTMDSYTYSKDFSITEVASSNNGFPNW